MSWLSTMRPTTGMIFLPRGGRSLARRLEDMGQFDRRRCHQYVCDEFSADLMARRYLALYERVLNGESLHEHAPVVPDDSDSKLLLLMRR